MIKEKLIEDEDEFLREKCVVFLCLWYNCVRENDNKEGSYRGEKLSLAVDVKCISEVRRFFSVSTHPTDEIMWD